MPGHDRYSFYLSNSTFPSPASDADELPVINSPSPTSSPISDVSPGPECGPKGLGVVIYDAYFHVARISDPSHQPHFHDMDPWDELGETLKELRRHGYDALECWELLVPLFLILQYEVIPIAKLKRDWEDPSARDARGVEIVLKQWRALSEYVVELEAEETKTILSTDKWILTAFLTQALHPEIAINHKKDPIATHLYLKNMPLGSMSEPDKLDFPLYIKLFKIPAHTIKLLNLSGNKLDYLPASWLSVFPRLWALELRGCGKPFLPFYWLRTQITVRGYTSRVIPAGERAITRPLPIPARTRRKSSLVGYCLMTLRRLRIRSGLRKITSNPRIQDLLLHSYTCELCDTECSLRSGYWRQDVTVYGDWMEKVRLYAPAVHLGETVYRGLEGRICRPCFEFLTPAPPVARRNL